MERIGKIGFMIKNGDVEAYRSIEHLNLSDLSLLIGNLEIVKYELLILCKELIKSQSENSERGNN